MAYPNGFFSVSVNANLLPCTDELPSTTMIDACAWNDPNDQVTAPVIGGVQYSVICLEDYAALDNFLAINNLALDENANYYFNLPPRP